MLIQTLTASANILVTENGGSTVTTEGGASDAYTIALTSSPKDDVIITAAFDDTQITINGATVSPVLFTFTSGACPGAGNWCTVQTVTVTAVDDALAEANPGTSNITHAAASVDSLYAGIPLTPVSAVITDNDSAGVSVTQSGGSTDITEAGGTDSYTAVLTTQPTANVTISVAFDTLQTTINGSGVSPVVLTFTAGACPAVGNWCTAQAVTVGAVNDPIAESSPHTSSITHSASSGDPNYSALAVGGVAASISDNDVPGITITQSGGSTDVTEAGGSDSYTVVLTTQPTANVTVDISFDALQATVNASGVSPVTLTFTAGTCPAVGNWCTAQTVTVAAVNDLFDETSPLASSITHSAASTDGNYNAIAVGGVTVNVTDNETAAVTITQSGGTTAISEAGVTDTYTAVLTTQPTADVTVNVGFTAAQTTINGSGASPVSLTFTAGACPAVGNWCTAQTVTVGAVNDLIMEADPHTSPVTHSATSGDANYNGIVIPTVTSSITDNDTAGATVTQSGGTTNVSEAGATDTYTIVLTSEPTASVSVDVSFTTAQTTINGSGVSPASLTFTAGACPAVGNWCTAQTVTVGAVNDVTAEANPHTSAVTHSATSGDANYSGVAIGSVNASISDNDSAGVTITQSSGSTDISETGPTTDSYTVVLTTEPTADVTVNVAFTTAQVTINASGVSPVALIFTAGACPATGNWCTAQTVTVGAVDDGTAETNPHTSSVTHTAVSGDGIYNGIAIGNVSASIADNDVTYKRVFNTSGTTNGSIGAGGIAGADAFCMADGNKPAGGTWKAMIADGGSRRACSTANCGGGPGEHINWVLAANKEYRRTDGTTVIMTTNANGIFVFGALSASFGGAGDYWTGLTDEWLGDSDCSNWTSTGNDGQTGDQAKTDTNALKKGTSSGWTSLHLLCVEQ